MSVLELLRGYTLREYAVVLVMAVLGGLGLVLMLNSMGGGSPAGETLLKRSEPARKETASVNFVESSAVAQARARAAAARRARLVAERRRAAAQSAARRARVVAARRVDTAPSRGATRTAPQPTAGATPVVNTTPSRPAPKPKAAPAPKPTPQKSGATGGGGGSFDDSG
jgi:hypothetical protein